MPKPSERSRELERRGHEALIAPVLTIEPVADATFDPASFDAIVMTSGNARARIAGASGLAIVRSRFRFSPSADRPRRPRATPDFPMWFRPMAMRPICSRWFAAAARRAGGFFISPAATARAISRRSSPPSGIHVETVVVYSAMAAARLPDDAEQAIRDGND